MELTELKGLVKKHDNQLDHMLQLNSETIKKYSYKSLKKTSIQPCGKEFLKLFALQLLRSVRVCISLQT